jgi:hypothetical protein
MLMRKYSKTYDFCKMQIFIKNLVNFNVNCQINMQKLIPIVVGIFSRNFEKNKTGFSPNIPLSRNTVTAP